MEEKSWLNHPVPDARPVDACTQPPPQEEETTDCNNNEKNIIQLPNDITCYILSLLSIREYGRARLTTPQWLHLPDSRSVLRFDPVTVLGRHIQCSKRHLFRSKFIKIVDGYMLQRLGNKRNIHSLVLEFSLVNHHASYIDTWIAACTKMKAEEIHLNFATVKPEEEKYMFPSHLMCGPFLKRLSLTLCSLSLSTECRDWLSCLTTLHLSHVSLSVSVVEHLLCWCSNLVSLSLSTCLMPYKQVLFINGQLQHLKKLTLRNSWNHVKLNCPNLEEFEYSGSSNGVTFMDVPLLRQVTYETDSDSFKFFYHSTRNSPRLQVLSLNIRREVPQPLLVPLDRCSSLKQLNLSVHGPDAYDLMTITYMFNAVPFLETLHILLWINRCNSSVRKWKRKYPKQPHFQLKKVEMCGYTCDWNTIKLASYLLRNAVALEQMILVAPVSESKQNKLLKKKSNQTAQLIIRTPEQRRLLKPSTQQE